MRILNKIALAALMACMPAVLYAGSISAGTLYVNLTTTIAVDDLTPIFILCTVPIGSCNAGSPNPLIHIENEGSVPVLTNAQDTFGGINTNIVVSGYITYLALAQSNHSDVVIGLANGISFVGAPWIFSTPESQIATDLAGGAPAQLLDLRNFFLNNLSDFNQLNGLTGNFAEFSTGVNVGSLASTAVLAPEPSTGALTALTLGAVVLFHRRRKVSRTRSV